MDGFVDDAEIIVEGLSLLLVACATAGDPAAAVVSARGASGGATALIPSRLKTVRGLFLLGRWRQRRRSWWHCFGRSAIAFAFSYRFSVSV